MAETCAISFPTLVSWNRFSLDLDLDLDLVSEIIAHQNGSFWKKSNHHNSRPEVDFVKIPTAFGNVHEALRSPLEIFRKGPPGGAGRGRTRKVGVGPKTLNPNFSEKNFKKCPKNSCNARMRCYLALKDVSRKLIVGKNLRVDFSDFWLGGPDPQTVTASPQRVTSFCSGLRALQNYVLLGIACSLVFDLNAKNEKKVIGALCLNRKQYHVTVDVMR